MADSDSVTGNQTVEVLQNSDTPLTTDEYAYRTCTIIISPLSYEYAATRLPSL